jgi:nicotinate-nucleotide pyrophosphorylase
MTNEQIEKLEADMIDAIDNENFAKAKAISEILEREKKVKIEEKRLEIEVEAAKENAKTEVKKAVILALGNFTGSVVGKTLHFRELNKVLAYESTGSLTTYAAKSIALKGGNN